MDETGGQVDSILNALLRAKVSTADEPQIEFESALSLGDVWALHRLWQEVGFYELSRVFRKAPRYTTAVEHAIRVMVFNRLCDPDSKLGVLRKLKTVSIPEVGTANLTHHQLLRSMDALLDHQKAVDLFTYQIDENALKQAELLDGKLLLVNNVTDLAPQEVVTRYKSLADIERGFKVLKSEIEIALVYHRLPHRIRAHAMICFMALILYRIMRTRLKMANTGLSPERALAQLKAVHRHQVKVNDKPVSGVSTLTKEQTDLLGTLTLTKPTKKEKLSLDL